eukprot:SAG25_NODE_1942_length_2115_cov_2.612599_1_plen_67_part_00
MPIDNRPPRTTREIRTLDVLPGQMRIAQQLRREGKPGKCCDEPGENCTGGLPRTCNHGCADILIPF